MFCIVRGIVSPRMFNHPRFTEGNPIKKRSRCLVPSSQKCFSPHNLNQIHIMLQNHLDLYLYLRCSSTLLLPRAHHLHPCQLSLGHAAMFRLVVLSRTHPISSRFFLERVRYQAGPRQCLRSITIPTPLLLVKCSVGMGILLYASVKLFFPNMP